MGSVKEIEEAIVRLSEAELAAIRGSFAEFDAEARDRDIGADGTAGRLESLAEEAVEDLRAGRCTERSGIEPSAKLWSCRRCGEI